MHKRPAHYCGSCFGIFKTQELLDAHSRQRPACEISDPHFLEKMSADQVTQIKQRRPGKDPCQMWLNIFKVLFPHATPPDSPYCETVSSVAVQRFSEYFCVEAPRLLSDLVRDRVRDWSALADYQQQFPDHVWEILDNVFEGSLASQIQTFGPALEELATSMSATSSSNSSQRPDSQISLQGARTRTMHQELGEDGGISSNSTRILTAYSTSTAGMRMDTIDHVLAGSHPACPQPSTKACDVIAQTGRQPVNVTSFVPTTSSDLFYQTEDSSEQGAQFATSVQGHNEISHEIH